MADKVQKEGCCKIDQIFGDDLNAKIGVLTRREVEARILAPIIIDTLSRQPGNAKVVEGAAYCDFRYTLKKDAEMCKLMIKSIFLILLIFLSRRSLQM